MSLAYGSRAYGSVNRRHLLQIVTLTEELARKAGKFDRFSILR
jgi:hypothetical protein